jgi:hypothetical protein
MKKNVLKSSSLLFVAALLAASLTSCDKSEVIDAGPLEFPCYITSNTVLTNHNTTGTGVDYICNCTAEVVNGTLTIEPGVNIVFQPDAGLYVRDNGVISAVGNASSPIVFTAASGTVASWEGVHIISNQPLNSLQYCTIEYAGGVPNNIAGPFTIGDVTAAVSVAGRASIRNTTINRSGGIGLFLHETAQLSNTSANTISNSTTYPIQAHGGQFNNNLDVASFTFSGNGREFISIHGDNSARVYQAMTFNRASIPYYMISDLEFFASATIAPGCVFIVSSNKNLRLVGDDSNFLRINGTASQPVIFRGEFQTPGYWDGILVNTSNPNTIFDYLQISDGGGESTGIYPTLTNIALGDANPATLTLNNCTSTNFPPNACAVAIAATDGNLINNSPNISTVCTY